MKSIKYLFFSSFLKKFLCIMLFACSQPASAEVTLEYGLDNWGITLNSFYSFAVHNGEIYAAGRAVGGSGNPTARLLKSTDGEKWTLVSSVPYEDDDFEIRRVYSASDGYLYIATQAFPAPLVYRSLSGNNWELVATLNNDDSYGRWFEEFDGCLYLSTVADRNIFTSRIFRSCNGTDWHVAVEFTENRGVYSLLVSDGKLYATTRAGRLAPNGGVFETTDGDSWTKINVTDFGIDSQVLHSLVEWQGFFWLGTLNPSLGGSIWRSEDLITWTQMTLDGMGIGPEEKEIYRIFPWGEQLLAGTFNRLDGGRIWISSDDMLWSEIGEPGAGYGNKFQGIFDFVEFENKVYTAHRAASYRTAVPTFPMALVLD
jgi:hypothetical protein